MLKKATTTPSPGITHPPAKAKLRFLKYLLKKATTNVTRNAHFGSCKRLCYAKKVLVETPFMHYIVIMAYTRVSTTKTIQFT